MADSAKVVRGEIVVCTVGGGAGVKTGVNVGVRGDVAVGEGDSDNGR